MNKSRLSIGVVIFIVSIIQALFFNFAHFYTLFSIGLVIIFLELYNHISKKDVFSDWRLWQFILFGFTLVLASIFIDIFGIDAGYWEYPDYNGLFDEGLKYIFEWGAALLYLMLGLMLGMEFCMKKLNIHRIYSFIISLTIFVTLIALFTEYINMFVSSWIILDMPLSNFKIGNFFIIFQTFGYWAMALLPYMIFLLIKRLSREK